MKLDKNGRKMTDSKGNYILDKDEKTGELKYEFKINDTVVGRYTKDAKLSDIMADINANKEAGVSVSYSQTTKNFLFKSKETGLESEIKIGEGLAEAMFGTAEVPDLSSSSFAESYGVDWLNDGESQEFTFGLPGSLNTKFSITKETTVEDVVNNLNDSLMGSTHTFAYNKYTGQIEAKDKNSGAALDLKITDRDGDSVEFDESKAPSVDYTPGQDAKFTITVNGETKEMTRSSNTVTIDGLSITMKDVFNGYEDADGNPRRGQRRKPEERGHLQQQRGRGQDRGRGEAGRGHGRGNPHYVSCHRRLRRHRNGPRRYEILPGDP